MKFINLNDRTQQVTFEEALLRGIAPDGGLYFPEQIPQFTTEELHRLIGAGRQAVALQVLEKWLGDEIPAAGIAAIVARASVFDIPVVEVGDKKILELFHGPTMAFKDVAAAYLAALLSYFNQKHDRHSTVLVATSGDTGGAIAHGFGDVSNLTVVVLYPKGRVSRLQQDQLRRVADNIVTLEIDGSFDDCQYLVKQALQDIDLVKKLNLTSANSINIGRLLPQSTYYAATYAQLGEQTGRFVVPSGNLGNVTGGMLARAMGIPIPGFLAATNANDALPRYLRTGEYQPNVALQTLSNAMDVGAPNNLPRLIALLEGETENPVQSIGVSDAATIETMKRVYHETGYILDPHTAVAWNASEAIPSMSSYPDIIVATASPLKFAEEIKAATGIVIDNTQELAALRTRPERYAPLSDSLSEFKRFLSTRDTTH